MLRQILRTFFILAVLLGFVSYALSLMVAGWTNLTDFAIRITEPRVCPANTTVRLDVVETIGNGRYYRTVADHFDCVNAQGVIVADKSTEQKNLWNLLLPISVTSVVALISLLIAIPVGINNTRKGISI